ncbi:MAG: ubiquinol-cytochrome C chaperone family protein [Alphaproteobacteria bacterium]|jgi:cytochrome b pre-mRNA-processing protein 3|nr:ubiquinol-cytochrome C chaperone family protein [Alphaproteobacteria bacterium]
MLFRRWFGSTKRVDASAQALYLKLVTQARLPDFYARLAVPDTLAGRFDMIVLHMFLLLRRLERGSGADRDLAQALFDLMFRDMDRSLREMGVSDQRIGRRIKEMIGAFYGRVRAYDQALAEGEGALEAALRRNVYSEAPRDEAGPGLLAAYVRREIASLASQPPDALSAGEVRFGPPLPDPPA